METVIITADSSQSGERIDKFISEQTDGISRSFAQALILSGAVEVFGKKAQKNYRIKGGEEITITVPDPEPVEAEPEEIALDIVYEDKDLIVINKPQGMVVHPAPGNYSGTLVNALLYHCRGELSAINGVIRPGIVHRIDKDTSGLIVAAKNNDTHIALAAAIKENKAERRYWALANGVIKEDFSVSLPIARNPKDRKKMAVVSGGRDAVTHFKVLENFNGYTLVECILETGRTHQIRVHLAAKGHSVVGDKVYGIKKERFCLNGQLLHAKTLAFSHPATGEYMKFESDIPDHFKRVLEILRKENSK